MPEVVCIYKWNEKKAKQLESWLGKGNDRYAVFLEDDPALLLSLPKTRQLKVVSTGEAALHQLAWEFVFLPFIYEGEGRPLVELARIRAMVNTFASDYADQGVTLYKNLKENLLTRHHIGASLFGQCKDVPAIICGAGPSLAKNGKELHRFQDQAVIFAGGAALEAVRPLGITPHFGAHVDADPKHKFTLSTVPLLCQLRTAHQSVKKSTGPKILLPGNGNFLLASWAQGELGVDTAPFDGGWTVATFCTAIALRMGCNPIIFVGMDLSTTKTRHYAPGVKEECPREELIAVNNPTGEPLLSRYDWILAAEWIEQAAKSCPNTKFINATEGGLGFRGVEEKKLADISFAPHRPIHFEPLPPLPDGRPVVAKIEESIVRCLDAVQAILKEIERVFPLSPMESGAVALFEHQLYEEVFYQKFLQPAWNVWEHVFRRHDKDGAMGLFLNKILFYQNLLTTFAPHASGTLS